MVTLEQVEKLRDRAHISYEEAKMALEKTDGDLLQAIINLEKEQKIAAPEGDGFFSSEGLNEKLEDRSEKDSNHNEFEDSVTLSELTRRFFNWIRHLVGRGNKNRFEVQKDGERVMSIPVTVLLVLALGAFWLTVPLIAVGMFFGYSYRFAGPDLGKENVNQALDSVAQVAENIKREVIESNERNHRRDSDN